MFVAPYVTLMTEDAAQRNYSLRDVFDALRYLVRSGCSWRMLPHDFPPHYVVYTQLQRWLKAGGFETMIHDLRVFLRWAEERHDHPTAAIQSPFGGGYFRPFVGLARYPRQRTRPRAGRPAQGGGPNRDGRKCRTGLCRSRLHRSPSRASCRSARH